MNVDQAIDRLQGPLSALFTPFDGSNRVNHDMLGQLVDFQLQRGIRGFFVAGTTGEGLLLTDDERIDVIRSVVQRSAGRAAVIAHVGHPSTDVATALARAAAAAGVDWIAAVGPIWYGQSFQGTLRHYRQIAAATELPFMIYSFGHEIQWQRDRALFDIPNVCGMKYTGSNFFSVQQLARRLDRPTALLSGFDEQFVAALSFGFQGGIGSTFNFAPEHYAGIFENYRAGNIAAAARLQSAVNTVTDLMLQYENWSYRKAIMRYIGFDCGPCRAPYAPLRESEYQALADQLDQLGVLQPHRPNH